MSVTIPVGYKLTEVGVIPEEWEVLQLTDVAAIKAGIAKNSNALPIDPVSVHYLRVANVQDGFLSLAEMSEIRVNRSDLQRYAVLPGDVLMNEGGDLDKLGRGAIWRGEFSPCIHQNHVFVVRCNSTILPAYLNIWTGTAVARRYFVVAGKQTTNLATINKTALGQLPVVLPPLPEQRAIATALSDVDALLAKLDQIITKKRDLKQAAMQQLLTGQTRLPGFSGEWDVKRLGDISPLQRGFDLLTSRLHSGPYPVVYSNGISSYHDEFMVKGPGVVTGRSGTIGNVHFVEGDFWPHNTSLWVTSFNGNSPKFIFYLLSSLRLDRFGTGSGVPTLNRNDVHAYSVYIPTMASEQTAIAAILCDMDTELAALQARRDKTQAVKRAMMQALLTGRIRLLATTPKP